MHMLHLSTVTIIFRSINFFIWLLVLGVYRLALIASVIMVKRKQKPVATLLSESKDSQNSVHNSSNVAVDSDLRGEDSWVVVKKQKVTILIPHLPSIEQCSLGDVDLSRDQPNVNKSNSTNAPPKLPNMKHRDMCLTEVVNGAIPLLLESGCHSGKSVPTTPDKAASNPCSRKVDSRAQNSDGHYNVLRPSCQKGSTLLNYDEIARASSTTLGVQEQSRVSVPCCTTILNKTMRVSNLKMKIARAGGVHKWLSCLGLEQFEILFGGKDLNNFQIANLSMKKLKDMGYHAVGPRRKLIHAIECCLCESYDC